jgi:serine/threonine protein kinase
VTAPSLSSSGAPLQRAFHFARQLSTFPDAEPEASSKVGVGAELGGYRLVRELGRGGMGQVFLATDPSGREVALKTILGGRGGQATSRLKREGELAASLQHPNVLRIHSAGVDQGCRYLVYELVRGCRTLDKVLCEVGREEGLRLFLAACRGVAFAHASGVVHRDLKPDNILVDESSRVRVADFGLARSPESLRLTQTGVLLGTPTFMPAEQILGRRSEVGPHSDVYALGAILYVFLTERLPFDGETLPLLLSQVVAGGPVSPRKHAPDTPRELADICLRALARQPADRYPNAGELADALEAHLDRGASGPSRRSPRAVAVLTCVVGLGAVAAHLLSWRMPPSQPRPRGPAAVAQSKSAGPSPTRETSPSYPLVRPSRRDLQRTPSNASPGFRLHLKAAREGSAAAAWWVGKHLDEGAGVDPEPELALGWWEEAARLDGGFRQRYWVKLLGRDRARGIRALRRAVREGDALARETLLSVVDPVEAAALVREGAEAGQAGSMFMLGLQLLDEEPQKGNAWLERAASEGHAWARYHLAQSLRTGRGLPRDAERAFDLYLQAKSEVSHAWVELGRLVGEVSRQRPGLLTPADYFRLGAEAGHAEAMREWARCLEQGEGVARDVEAAQTWRRKAGQAK